MRQTPIKLKKIAIFSSSEGSNAANLMHYFKNHPFIGVDLLVSDRFSSQSLVKAAAFGVPTFSFSVAKEGFPAHLPFLLKERGIDLVVLAGYFSLLPICMIEAFPQKIINIHPSLLPHFGGKGCYGSKLLDKILRSGHTSTGITIHFVDEEYDHGQIVFQKACEIDHADTVESLRERMKILEYQYYPKVVEAIFASAQQEKFVKDERI